MEQLYTIPVNEAFEAADGCPFCTLYNMLEANELDTILGGAMMEPDIRLKTNEAGFCGTHFHMLQTSKKNILGLGLLLESHLDEVAEKVIPAPSRFSGDPIKKLDALEESCYICGRIDHSLEKMMETAVLLWTRDEAFRQKAARQPFYCLPHYRTLLETAKARMNKKQFAAFLPVLAEVETAYLDKLREDVRWFCKKFDYRYDDEPWKDARDAPQRAIAFLTGDLHRAPEKKK